jgi:hypothetical protein
VRLEREPACDTRCQPFASSFGSCWSRAPAQLGRLGDLGDDGLRCAAARLWHRDGVALRGADTDRDAALLRHETLLRHLERGGFPQETSREILQAIHPPVAQAIQAFRDGDPRAAAAALEEGLRTAGRLDLVRRFLHLYDEIFLMRALVIEKSDTLSATAANRELIALRAEHPLHHPDTLRAVARAREAVERLTPVPTRT